MLSTFLLEQGYAVKEVSPTTEQEIGKVVAMYLSMVFSL